MKMVSVKLKQSTLIFLVILTILSTYLTGYADITAVNERTPAVRDAIVGAVPNVDDANDVTETHLAAITSLNLRNKGITKLKSCDFCGLSGLITLNLYNNELSSLPDHIFKGLTALMALRLGGNKVEPLAITVSLEIAGVSDSGGQFKAVAVTCVPFDIVLPISVENGSINGGVTSLTIPKGSYESESLTLTRTEGTLDAVTVDIESLPNLPKTHYGYTLAKSKLLPLSVIGTEYDSSRVEPEDLLEDPEGSPVFTDGTSTIRVIAENTDADVNIGRPVTATDINNDDITYSLSGTDSSSFNIDSITGQLKTKAPLDYETKRIYLVTITASDGTMTDTITVIISIIDVADTDSVSVSLSVSDRTVQVRDAIVNAVPGITDAANVTATHLASITSLNLRSAVISKLKTGDFSGLTSLTLKFGQFLEF